MATKRIYTPEEYLELERAAETKSEYVNGEIVAMSGASMMHNRVQMNITAESAVRLRGAPCEPFGSDMRIQTTATHYCYPDFSVVCGKPLLADRHVDTILNPTVVIEILSPSTEAYDRGLKFARYRAIDSLREYVLVSQDEPKIERFLLTDAVWEHLEVEGLDSTIRLDSIGIDLPLSAVYARVDLTPPD